MKSFPSTPDRRKIIGQEIIKFHTALSLDLVADIIDAKVALAMTDWEDIPTHWLRRTCRRARKQCAWMPKPAEILNIWKGLRAQRRLRKNALAERHAKRALKAEARLPSEAERLEFMRQSFHNMGEDYDKVMRRDKLLKELNHKRRSGRPLEVNL